jgi:hypothetical protein
MLTMFYDNGPCNLEHDIQQRAKQMKRTLDPTETAAFCLVSPLSKK